MKNSFAPINQVPPEVLSLIPCYYPKDCKDRNLIALTHVSRGWRDIFSYRSSLWTRLDFTNVDKTHIYIQRSHPSPLELHLEDRDSINSTFAPVIPHICRVKSLMTNTHTLPKFLEHFRCRLPLLEKLDMQISDPTANHVVFDGSPFDQALRHYVIYA